MKIIIPQYLKSIPIISQFIEMFKYYGEHGYSTQKPSSFDGYREALRNDPIRYFVDMCFSRTPEQEETGDETEEELAKKEKEFNAQVVYISKLFTTVKGTNKVFDYMKRYLGGFLNIEDITINGRTVPGYYDGRVVHINFSNLTFSGLDPELFYTALLRFFDALFVYEYLDSNIGTVDLILQDEVTNYIRANLVCYKYLKQ